MKFLMNIWIYISSLLVIANASDVLVSVPLDINGVTMDMKLMKGETPEMAARAFAQSSGLISSENPDQVVEELTRMLKRGLTERSKPQELRSGSSNPGNLILSIPIALDDAEQTINIYEGQTIDDVVNQFMEENNLSTESRTNLRPQLIQLIQDRLLQLQDGSSKKLLFSVGIDIDGKSVPLHHYEGNDPVQEASEFCNQNGFGEEPLYSQYVPQLANLIQQKLEALRAEKEAEARRELGSFIKVPIVIDGRQFEITHYESRTPEQTAFDFLTRNGITDEAVLQNNVPQIARVILERIQSDARSNVPKLTIPVMIDQKSLELEFLSGQNPEIVAELFMKKNQLENHPDYSTYVAQLGALIRKRALEMQQEATEVPILSLPIKIGETVEQLRLFQGQHPRDAGIKFCQTNWDVVKNIIFINDSNADAQFNECVRFLEETGLNALENMQKERESLNPVLFAIDIEVSTGNIVPLQFRKGDDPESVARLFCQENQIDTNNVESLVRAIQANIEKL